VTRRERAALDYFWLERQQGRGFESHPLHYRVQATHAHQPLSPSSTSGGAELIKI